MSDHLSITIGPETLTGSADGPTAIIALVFVVLAVYVLRSSPQRR